MVAVHQRKEEFKPPNPPTGGLKEDILSQFGFIYKKGARFILRFFTDRSTVSKKIEMNKNYGTLHWSQDQDLPYFR